MSKRKILIIEDDVAMGEILQLKLQQEGYIVYWCRDGLSGLDTLKLILPDLVVTDVVLPVMNGIELLIEKNKLVHLAKIPVIILSNSFVIKDANRINNLNVSAFLIKSNLTPTEILGIIENIMNPLPVNNDASHMNEQSSQKELNDTLIQIPAVEKTSVGISAPVISHGIPTPIGTSNIQLSGYKLLLVEDDPFLHSILAKKFENEGMKVIHVINGENALKEIADVSNSDLQIIILDILLPGISGFEVLSSIRENSQTENMPVIMISNFSQQEELLKARSMGAHYLVKALVSPDDIVLKIKEVVAGALV